MKVIIDVPDVIKYDYETDSMFYILLKYYKKES